MSNVDINKEAFKQAEKELFDDRVKKVKGYILETLKKIELKKKEKELIEEQLRILKLDLEDLKNGKFDKIEERVEKSKIARGITVVPNEFFSDIVSINNSFFWPASGSSGAISWPEVTSGTYTVTMSTGDKIFYF